MSTLGDASPQRQRRSFSPASPPVNPTKDFLKGKQAPQTPPPSVHMSPSWSSNQSTTMSGLANTTSNTSASTPPALYESQGHMMARTGSSEGSVRSGQNTPATELEQSDSEARKVKAESQKQRQDSPSGQNEETHKRKREAEEEISKTQDEQIHDFRGGSATPPKKQKTEGEDMVAQHISDNGGMAQEQERDEENTSTARNSGQIGGGKPGASPGKPETGNATPIGTLTTNEHTNPRKRERDEIETESSKSEEAKRRKTDHEPSTADTTTGGDQQASQEPVTGAGGLHFLRTQPVPMSNPRPYDDLLEMYDLKDIQQSVARKDPVTGEKINKLRKSYESKVKNLGLEGKPKAKAGNRELEGLVEVGWDQITPDGLTWFQANHAETSLGDGGNADQMFARLNLDAALSFVPGKLPVEEDRAWTKELGLEEPASGAKGTPLVAPTKTVAGKAMAKTHPSQLGRNSAPASPLNMQRPERQNKKRRYDDSSFTGYNEGFDDDGYSTGGIDDRASSGGKRQKRKVSGRVPGCHVD